MTSDPKDINADAKPILEALAKSAKSAASSIKEILVITCNEAVSCAGHGLVGKEKFSLKISNDKNKKKRSK